MTYDVAIESYVQYAADCINKNPRSKGRRIQCHAIRRNSAPGYAMSPWAVVAGVNAVCAIGWAISLYHYMPAIELGGRHLVALHLAACLVALKRMAVLRRAGDHASLPLSATQSMPASP